MLHGVCVLSHGGVCDVVVQRRVVCVKYYEGQTSVN